MSKRFVRAAGAGLAAVAVAGIGVLVAAPAHAATVGQVTIVPGSGVDTDPIQFQTTALCADGTSNFQLGISGGAFPAGAAMTANAAQTTLTQANGGYLATPLYTFAGLASHYGIAFTAGTTYNLDFQCKPAFGAAVDDMTGTVTFSDAHTWKAGAIVTATPTTTTVAGSAASGQQGTAATFTATVSPAAATGTVQFLDDGTPVGTPATVTNGTATLTTSALPVGAQSITAAFTPGTGTYQSSTSTAAFTYTVTAAPAQATTTALGVTPNGTAVQNSAVTLTATVAPASGTGVPAGTVQFTDGTANLGAPVPVKADGTASLTLSTLATGTHSFNAAFTTSNGSYLSSATTTATPYAITAQPGVSTSEPVTATVPAGTLAIAFPQGSSVTLPTAALDANGDLFQTSGTMTAVAVTDTRAGDPGWTVSGQIQDFVSTTVSSNTISGENLGWTPTVVDKSAAQTVALGNVVDPGNGIAAGDAGNLGLKGSKTLATGTGLGTSHLSAGLAMNIPTSTPAGSYTATLTLTAI
jgi:hypothetical protein